MHGGNTLTHSATLCFLSNLSHSNKIRKENNGCREYTNTGHLIVLFMSPAMQQFFVSSLLSLSLSKSELDNNPVLLGPAVAAHTAYGSKAEI